MKNVYLIGGAILGAYVLHKIISHRNKKTLMSMEAERQKPVSFLKPVRSTYQQGGFGGFPPINQVAQR
jgi:hypothetical protein